jgi:predicted dehydrogenase|tara:strand:+ start:274 stop:1230 length:957 start_codon:yes stop_codon:yes gene_type:complete
VIGAVLIFANRRIALIGNGSQAQRIKATLKCWDLEPHCIFKPTLREGDSGITDDFDKVRACDTIFLCSPNKTHFDYLKSLIGERYIFCEKPPVQSHNHIDALRKLDNGKIHYNFNLRYSEISNFLLKARNSDFGELISASITISHGLATKPAYETSWRANSSLCPKGVFEIVSVHAVDLIGFHFDIANIDSNELSNRSGLGTGYDTANTMISLINGGRVNVFSTYVGPYFFDWTFVFENGLLIADPSGITLRGPRAVFDSRGFFKLPPIIEQQSVDSNEDYAQSLERSVAVFLDTTQRNDTFDPRNRDLSLFSNSFII